ncbi:MAG: hypothetical protein AB7G88_09960 [Thermomicrobiales bacterium]
MAEEWTCGKGLAAHSVLPLAMGRLMSAMATMLDRHTLSLDPGQQEGREEFAAYAELVARHALLASELETLANRMEGYEALPMAEHDMETLTSSELDDAFRAVVQAEEDLLGTLQSIIEEHQQTITGT